MQSVITIGFAEAEANLARMESGMNFDGCGRRLGGRFRCRLRIVVRFRLTVRWSALILMISLAPLLTSARPLGVQGARALPAFVMFQEEPPDIDPAARAKRAEGERTVDRMLRGLPENQTMEEQGERQEALRLGIPYDNYHAEIVRRKEAEKYLRELHELAAKADIPQLLRDEKLSAIVNSEDFRYMSNREKLANAYAASLRMYEICGIRRSGSVDKAYLSGRALLIAHSSNVFSALPRDAREYKGIEVAFIPDNSSLPAKLLSTRSKKAQRSQLVPLDDLLFKHIGSPTWVPAPVKEPLYAHIESSQPEAYSANKRSTWARDSSTNQWRISGTALGSQSRVGGAEQLPLRTLTVKKVDEWTRISIYPQSAKGGTETWMVASTDPGAVQDIASRIGHAKMIVHVGDDMSPELMASFFGSNRGAYIRKSDRSANVSEEEVSRAAELGNRPLSLTNVKILNALPQELGWLPSLSELWRMNLELGQRDGWRRLQAEVKQTASNLNVGLTPASKVEVLRELSLGSSDVIFLVAHSEGGSFISRGKTVRRFP
jgi:hypothetical protein